MIHSWASNPPDCSALDVYESVLEDDLKLATVIVASFVHYTEMREEKLPREPLPKPMARP